MIEGQLVRVVAGPGGWFRGRTGRVFRVVTDGRTWIGVKFDGIGTRYGLPFWFSREELEPVAENDG